MFVMQKISAALAILVGMAIAFDSTDTLMDGDSPQTGYLPNHVRAPYHNRSFSQSRHSSLLWKTC